MVYTPTHPSISSFKKTHKEFGDRIARKTVSDRKTEREGKEEIKGSRRRKESGKLTSGVGQESICLINNEGQLRRLGKGVRL
jgi:hypothetical protein